MVWRLFKSVIRCIMPNYSDDEEPVQQTQKDATGTEVGEKLDVRIINDKVVSNRRTGFDVSVELIGSARLGEDNRQLGVDIVLLVDVSSSMSSSKKQEFLKTAMAFLIRKLSPIHRLSVVQFSTRAERLCPLLPMTEDARGNIEKLIEHLGIHTNGGTKLAAGLKKALKVFKDRNFFKGRKSALIILSGSEASFDAARVPLGDVPVHAFAIGGDFPHDLLKQIATKSVGGTFTILDIENKESISNLSHIFSQCLAGLLTVVVEDLKLTVTPLKDTYSMKEKNHQVKIKSRIEQVDVGLYHPQTEPDATGSITISLGHLYHQERCKILFKLLLPAVHDDEDVHTKVLQLIYSYSVGGESYDGGPILVAITRRTFIPDAHKQSGPITDKSSRLILNAFARFITNKDKFKSVHKSANVGYAKSVHDIGKKTS